MSTFDATIDLGLDYIKNNQKEPIKTTDLQKVNSVTNLLECFIREDLGFKGDEDEKKKILECLFALSYAWGLGASLLQSGKDRLDTIVRDNFKSA